MINPIYYLNQKYDDLQNNGHETARFLIFFAIIISIALFLSTKIQIPVIIGIVLFRMIYFLRREPYWVKANATIVGVLLWIILVARSII